MACRDKLEPWQENSRYLLVLVLVGSTQSFRERPPRGRAIMSLKRYHYVPKGKFNRRGRFSFATTMGLSRAISRAQSAIMYQFLLWT